MLEYECIIEGIRYTQLVRESDAEKIVEMERNGWKRVEPPAPAPVETSGA
jgi:hypothetical protein